ncbi:MAG: Ldh family oxidoreductase [Paracoccus sp. (in: a-proteobacteria)]|nr:Ldh family oxidoreductase [Paracoccus sp. (in: a-proteobacteria)]
MIAAGDAVARLSAGLGDGPAARLAASALVEADLLGQPRFGIAMLDEWQPGGTALPPSGVDQPLVWRDCAGTFAPLAVAGATLDLAGAARHFGIAAAFLRGVRGFGRLAPFMRHLADQGLIGMAGAEGPPFVAPQGGTRPVIGTNPLALAMGKGQARVVIDIASSSATMADIRQAQASGATLPEGIALDAGGQPTRTAAQVAALLPRGGRIGSLLGLIVALLAGVAGGGRGDAQGRGLFLLALDPSRAGDDPAWLARLARLQDDWRGGGGYWPQGGGLAADARLDADFLHQLNTHLARMDERAAP